MYPRKIEQQLLNQADDRKISFLLGARQVGKTTLLKTLAEKVSSHGKSLYLDLDIISNYEKVSTFETLMATLKVNGYQETEPTFFYLFLDEFQHYPDLGRIMKNVYDNTANVKIYASGSSSLAMKEQIQESLAGRKIINDIYPLDFEEFLWFKCNVKLISNFSNLQNLRGENLQASLTEYDALLEEFLVFGGYPEVALKVLPAEKKAVLQSIFDLYVKKDLIDHLRMDKILGMKKVIEFLAVNNGQKIKYEEICTLASLPSHSVKKYIEILEETYLIKVVRPYHTNKNKELIKIPKIYFIDSGVSNFFCNNFNNIALRNDGGYLLESFILSELIKGNLDTIYFWQDKNRNEVDFIIKRGDTLIPLEVKNKINLKQDDFRGLVLFAENYPNTKNKYLINRSIQKKQHEIFLVLPYAMELIKHNVET